MSKSDEFSHGTEHRFGVKRDFAGWYTSCCGMTIQRHHEGGWNMTWPGEYTPDHTARTLQEAKAGAEIHHGSAK
jgi:hypothetical protein